MTEYGLPNRRDSEGNRKAQEHSYEWNGQEITIKIIPPSVAQAEEYEALGDDIAPTEMAEIVNKHVEKPQIEAEDMGMDELLCYAEGIFDYVQGGDDFEAAVDAELEQRESGEGN